MCGITGIFSFNLVGKFNKINISAATTSIESRGPDFHDVYVDEWVGLGHRRLCIIDTSSAAHQPLWDESRRYAIVYNGEIFNYKELRSELQSEGVTFFSDSDTEVLLKLYIRDKEKCVSKLNGFFAFCIYDKHEQTFFLARDRFGVKPLLYLFDEHKFIFASEMKSILQYGIEKQIDFAALQTYLQLNYIPGPNTILTSVKKLQPGCYIKLTGQNFSITRYYEIPYDRDAAERNPIGYEEAKKQIKELLERAVQRRLVADVPLGAFLSGGIDSSIITGLARNHKPDLQTFSIGFKDEKFFDETAYARLVAGHFKTDHTVFSLSNDDLYSHVHDILNYLDEPFGDSSAINVYILSRETRKYATVALSGDGADELLGGYNKHEAFYRTLHPTWKETMASALMPALRLTPQSRNSKWSNAARQLIRFAEGRMLPPAGRWWKWAGYASEDDVSALLRNDLIHESEYQARKNQILDDLTDSFTINDVLLTDTKVVLPDDMQTKVDLVSMAQSLEVRAPFLDYELVNFVFSLPSDFKINKDMRKRVLQDPFRDILPAELYNRPKKGFEVPMLKWLRKQMRSLITDDLLSKKTIEEQRLFNYSEVEKLKRKLFSSNPGDVHARIWGLVVFQWWWKKYMGA